MNDLLSQINAFLDKHLMEPSAFGIKAARDSHLYFDLKEGRKLRRRTVAKVEDFMRTYKNGKKK